MHVLHNIMFRKAYVFIYTEQLSEKWEICFLSDLIPMDTKCATLLADLFLYSYEAEFFRELLHEKKKVLAAAFNSKFWYRRCLSFKNNQFYTYVDSIYLNELEIKDS
jgi:hypothetical protein